MQCCDAIRLPGQPQSVNFLLLYCSEAEVFIPQVIFTFFGKQWTWIFSPKKKNVGGKTCLYGCLQDMLLMNTSIQRCMLLFPALVMLLWTDWLLRNSLLLQVEVFQSCPLGKGIFVKGNLYKWEMCALLEFKRAPSLSSLSFCLIHTKPAHTHHGTFSVLALLLFPQQWLWNDSIF